MKNITTYLQPVPSLSAIMKAFLAGLLISVMEIFFVVSFASLLFSGELGQFINIGIGLSLFGTLIFFIFALATSSFENTISVIQDAPLTILAVVTATMLTEIPQASVQDKLALVIGTIILTTILTGVFLWLLGAFNLGNYVRFIPYPVIGGFLAGTGTLVILGGIQVMVDAPVGFALFASDNIWRWLPGFLFGIGLLFLLRSYTQAWLMPLALILGTGLFYITYFVVNGTIGSVANEGWLLGPFPEGMLWTPVVRQTLPHINWSLILTHGLKYVSILIISAISILLNISGIELVMQNEVALDKELKWSGIANVVAGLFGSPIGFHALSSSALGHRLGGQTRLVGLFVLFLVGLTIFLGGQVLSFFPKLLFGGLLVFVGADFLVEWLYESWYKLPRLDYLLIWLILITIVVYGYLEGVAIGIVIATLFFVYNYSQTNFIRHAIAGNDYQSHIMRPRLYEQLLQQRGYKIFILELQGFLFFGTAHNLVEKVKNHLDSVPRFQYLILDFRLVNGIDSSAMLSFTKLFQLGDEHKFQLILTNLSKDFQNQFYKNGFDDFANLAHFSASLQQGLNWCEDQLIENYNSVGLVAKPESLIRQMRRILADDANEVNWVDYLKPGTFPKPSEQYTQFLSYFEKIEFKVGDYILGQGSKVKGLYFLEVGQIKAQIEAESNQIVPLEIVETPTIFGETSFFAEQAVTKSFVATQAGFLFYLSSDNLRQLEVDRPDIAVVFHRKIAGILSHKAIRAADIALAMQK